MKKKLRQRALRIGEERHGARAGDEGEPEDGREEQQGDAPVAEGRHEELGEEGEEREGDGEQCVLPTRRVEQALDHRGGPLGWGRAGVLDEGDVDRRGVSHDAVGDGGAPEPRPEARKPGAADHDHRRALRAGGLDDGLGDVGAGHHEDLRAQLAGEREVGLEPALLGLAQRGASVDVDGRPVGPERVGRPPRPASEVGRAGGRPSRLKKPPGIFPAA